MALCTLCDSSSIQSFFRDEKRHWEYFQCQNCGFVFRDPESYLSATAEKARYKTHNNSIENEGYVRFLTPVVDWLMPHLDLSAQGLDYGSGPGPILDQLFAQQGVALENYDPYFAPDKSVLEKTYDFVTCTEVFEHFYQPGQEMNKLTELVKPAGFLLMMSEWRKDLQHFKNWGYRMDNTHVCFLNEESLGWLAERWGFHVLKTDGRLMLLQKNPE